MTRKVDLEYIATGLLNKYGLEFERTSGAWPVYNWPELHLIGSIDIYQDFYLIFDDSEKTHKLTLSFTYANAKESTEIKLAGLIVKKDSKNQVLNYVKDMQNELREFDMTPELKNLLDIPLKKHEVYEI